MIGGTLQKNPVESYHRFLDEAGDTTFYGKGKVPIIGTAQGVSLSFILGMVKFRTSLSDLRSKIQTLQQSVAVDKYFKDIPSILKKVEKGGYYFHATDDIPEVRKIFFDFIQTIDCSFEAVIGRKIPSLFAAKHNNNESEFYADLLSHLLKNKMSGEKKFVLNIAARGNTTKNDNLQKALTKAVGRYLKKKPNSEIKTKIVFNVQNQITEPLLNVADYFCWSVQRVFERGEMRYYNFLQDKISLVVDLYDAQNYAGNKNYYNARNALTVKNKLSPPLY